MNNEQLLHVKYLIFLSWLRSASVCGQISHLIGSNTQTLWDLHVQDVRSTTFNYTELPSTPSFYSCLPRLFVFSIFAVTICFHF